MTKKQEVQRAKAGLTLDHVVSAAFVVLNRDGLAKLSTRAIAAELGVSMNTVMWHIGTKDRLLDVMADTIVGQVDLAKLHGSDCEQASELIERLRQAMLSHRDGASVVAGTSPVMSSTLAFGDHLLTVLFEVCPTYKSAAWTAWNLLYFTLGLVQEEQRHPPQCVRSWKTPSTSTASPRSTQFSTTSHLLTTAPASILVSNRYSAQQRPCKRLNDSASHSPEWVIRRQRKACHGGRGPRWVSFSAAEHRIRWQR